MNSEELKNKLKGEGFANIYEWTDAPNTEYSKHTHKGKVSFYVTKGDIVIYLDDIRIVVRAGDRIDVLVGMPHTAKVGPNGCTFIVGEEIKGDS